MLQEHGAHHAENLTYGIIVTEKMDFNILDALGAHGIFAGDPKPMKMFLK